MLATGWHSEQDCPEVCLRALTEKWQEHIRGQFPGKLKDCLDLGALISFPAAVVKYSY